jgi:hypothetical protein
VYLAKLLLAGVNLMPQSRWSILSQPVLNAEELNFKLNDRLARNSLLASLR